MGRKTEYGADACGGSTSDRRELFRWTLGSLVFLGLPAPRARARGRRDDVGEIVRWLVTTPREPVVERAARELATGLPPARLSGALLVAAAREIRPDIARFNHSALVVSSIDQLRAALPEREGAELLLWEVDAFKAAQDVDARSDDYRQVPPKERAASSPDAARRELSDALEDWDAEAADAAVEPFVRSANSAEVFELLWEFGARCQANIGHKGIYAAMAHRALPLAGAPFTVDVLRSLVASFSIQGKGERSAPFEHSRDIAALGIEPRSDSLADESSASRELEVVLRDAAPVDAPKATAELLRRGAERRVAWDALALAAANITAADPGIAPLHALTSLNALHYIARSARTERVRTIALLQAAAWSCLFRDSVLRDADRKEIPSAAGVELDPADARICVATRADEVHEVKLAAAALEELALAGPSVRPALTAALAAHLPPRDRPEDDARSRIHDALARASRR